MSRSSFLVVVALLLFASTATAAQQQQRQQQHYDGDGDKGDKKTRDVVTNSNQHEENRIGSSLDTTLDVTTVIRTFDDESDVSSSSSFLRRRRRLQDDNTTATDEEDKTTTVEVGMKVVGGSTAAVGEFPCFVQAGNGGCGGAYLWKDIVLTAGHCKSSFTSGAYIGAYRMRSTANGAEFERVDRVVVHPNFDLVTLHWDFAIVKLWTIPKGDHDYCKLNRKSGGYPSNGAPLQAIGLGKLSENGGFPTVLQKVSLNAVDVKTCVNNYRGTDPVFMDSMICASSPGGSRDTCYGDSGGPVFDVPDGNIVGLTSTGEYCASPQYPGVYSKVAAAVKWIDEVICQISRRGPFKCTAAFARQQAKKKKNQRKKRKRSGGRALLDKEEADARETDCDNTNDFFDVTDDIVDKDCDWLETNRDFWNTNSNNNQENQEEQYDDLCHHLYIASKCPKTCHVCDLVNAETGLLEYE